MKAIRSLTKLNELTEVRIGNCIFSKNDIEKMYIDQGLSIQELAERLETSVWRANQILEKFGIPKNWNQNLTPRRLRVLRYIIWHQKKYRKSPSLSEISRKLDIPVSCVHFHMRNLKRLGYLEWDGKKRKIHLKERCKECQLI